MKYTSIRFIFCILITSVFIGLSINGVSANPFFGERDKKTVAPPPVFSGGSNTFIKLQFEYREKIALILRKIKNDASGKVYFFLLLISFMYGIFHAAGPGHRKTVVFSLFLAQKVRWYVPACAGFLSAGIHAGCSIAIISILYLIQRTIITLSGTDNVYAYMEGITFIILALFSLVFILYKISTGFKRAGETEGLRKRKLYPLIMISSIVPCPGATMLLLLALYAGIFGAGIAGVIAMSFGMGIVISLAGYLAYAGRTGLFSIFKRRENTLRVISSFLEIISFVIIFLFSAVMAWPFVRSIIHII